MIHLLKFEIEQYVLKVQAPQTYDILKAFKGPRYQISYLVRKPGNGGKYSNF